LTAFLNRCDDDDDDDDDDDEDDVDYFVQQETKLDGANSSTNVSLLEEFRYHADNVIVNGSHLSAELSLYKDPVALSRLGFPLRNFTRSEPLSQFVFVTAADDRYFHVAMDAIARIQLFFPNHSIYFYDLSGGVLDIKVDKVNTLYRTEYIECTFVLERFGFKTFQDQDQHSDYEPRPRLYSVQY